MILNLNKDYNIKPVMTTKKFCILYNTELLSGLYDCLFYLIVSFLG